MRGLFGELVPDPAVSATAAVECAGFALVAVERAVDRYPEGLLYAVPVAFADLAEGDRVEVPLGRGDKPTPGYVVRRMLPGEPLVGRDAALDPRKIKALLGRDRAHATLPGELLRLARWMSGYYCTPIGMTLAAMLPASVRQGVGATTRTLIDLAEPPMPEAGGEIAPPRGGLSRKQRDVLAIVAALPPSERPIEMHELLGRAGVASPAPVKALAAKGLVRIERRTTVEARFLRGDLEAGNVPTPTAAQAAAIDGIGATLGRGFSQHLLFGVTGAGKTEVYIRLIDRVLAAGKRALVLVPEIGLTPQTAGRLVSRFPGRRVAILHSGLTASERHGMWASAARGEAHIVLGARSALFAPIPDGSLGLVVVDEEHDSSYKADQAPRYHGRDAAIRRAQIAGCPIVLGSATPSLESWWNASRRGVSTLHRLPGRAPGLRTPKVLVVDFNEERRRYRDRRVHLIGPTLRDALAAAFESGGQAVILLNRRGYANYIACTDPRCDWVFRCDQCDAGMVCHRSHVAARDGTIGVRDFTRCHHCQAELRLPRTCPVCGKTVSVFGLGTQRVEEELHRIFPQLIEGKSMIRVDADAMHDEGDFRDALDRFARGEARVLLGTQMIAKGLDFPNVRVVGVISADTALHLPDFRAAERTFQLVAQVAGRCGRGDQAGLAVVQTFQPTAPPIVLAAKHDYEQFAEGEIADRERFGLPPVRRMARLVVRDAGDSACGEAAQRLSAALRAAAARPDHPSVEIRGPAPCPIARIAGRYRQQIEVLAAGAGELARFLTEARNADLLPLGEALAVDVDPIALL